MIKLTDELASGTMNDEHVHQCELRYSFTNGEGKVVTHMIQFAVSEPKFNEQYQNYVHDLGVL